MDKKTVIITGAAGALSKAVIKVLAKSEYNFGLLDLHADNLSDYMESIGVESGRYIALKTDITDQTSIDEVINKIISKFNKIDIVLHIAGTYKGGKSVFEESPENFDFLMNLNAKSFILLCKAIFPLMKENKFGRIITIGTRNVATFAPPLSGLYTASKAALVKLTETLAYEVINDNITVNAILPSVIDTSANRENLKKMDTTQWVNPENIGYLIAYLISEQGKDITGASIPVYGRVR